MSSFHSIGNFVNAFNGGTRPNRFRITATAPEGVAAPGGLFIDTHCVAATVPESIVGIIPIPFRGRMYKFPGDRTYNEWTVTVLDDTNDKATWFTFHEWSQLFNNHETNIAVNASQRDSFCKDLTIEHLDHSVADGSVALKKIKLLNAWPVQVGPVQLDMGAANQLVQFQVQIAYTHFQYEAQSTVSP
jgi:hypothetical protein